MGVLHFLNLSFQIAKSGFKLRNEGSYLGIFWYLLNPLLLFILLVMIFSNSLGNEIPMYHLYLLLGIIIFNFFQQSTSESTKIIIKDYREIIKSINFPRESIFLGIVLKFLFSHIFEVLLFAIFLIFMNCSFIGIIFYPIILFFLVVFIFGFSLILSSLTIYFVDLEHIWNFFVRLMWFGTPIFYAIEEQGSLFFFNLFNPLYYFITISREVIIYNTIPELWMIFGAVFYSLLSLFLGLIIFNKLKIRFAEMI